MRIKFIALITLIYVAMIPGLAFAQSPAVEWTRWDDQITVKANSDTLQIAETQEIRITSGTVQHGTRLWTSPVQVQNAFLIVGNSATPTELTVGDGNQPGTYNVSQRGNQTTLAYALTTPQNAGDSYIAQFNYTAITPTTGVVDWNVVPADHDFPVNSSTVTIHFPDGQMPDSTLMRIAKGNGTVKISGNDLIISSSAPIAAQQAFAIQVPFGIGVGAAAQPGSNTAPLNPPDNAVNPAVPAQDQPGFDASAIQLPGPLTLLAIVCGGGLILLIVLLIVGSLLRGLFSSGNSNRGYGQQGGSGLSGMFGSLVSGVIGSLLGNLLGGGNGSSGGSSLGGDPNLGNDPGFRPSAGGQDRNIGGSGDQLGQGFRPSEGGQNRNMGNVGNDKNSGGGAHFS